MRIAQHRWSVIVIALLLTLAFVLPVSAQRNPQVGVQIQNKTESGIEITAQSYPQNGGDPETLGGGPKPVLAEGAYNYWIPGENLSPGSSALVVSSTGEAGGIARTDFTADNSAAIYSTTDPNQSVLVPLVLNDYAGQTSNISVQNTDILNDIADVTLTLYARGSSTPLTTLVDQTIANGTSRTWSLSDSVWGNLPDSGENTTGFVGSMLIESPSTSLVVQSFIDNENDSGNITATTGFTGVAADSASNSVFCPLIRANYYGDTGISIVNNNGTAATVDIKFRADPASIEQGEYDQQVSVDANSSTIVFQGPTGDSRQAPTNLPAGTGQDGSNTALTNNGFYGTAELISTQPILAVVNDTEFGASWTVLGQSTYNCSPAPVAPQEAKTHYLPLLRRQHNGSQALTTGVQVFNITDSASTVTLSLSNSDGTPVANNPASKNMTAKGAANFIGFNWDVGPEWFGSGVIECTQDCIVFVSDEGYNSALVIDRANYNGIVK